VRVPGGKGRGTPADLACTTDAGKRDAGEAKKGVWEDAWDREYDGRRAEPSEEERDTKRAGDADTDDERRLVGKQKCGEDEKFGEDENRKLGEGEKFGEGEK
jgi:hypothetical protein